MADKLSQQLPTVRITERLETSLMRAAARDDRSLSDYIRVVLERHCFGHSPIVADGCDDCQPSNAVQSTARNSSTEQGS